MSESQVFFVVPLALKAVDWGLSMQMLAMPRVYAVEANPFTAYLLGIHPMFALATTLLMVVCAGYGLRWTWRMREALTEKQRLVNKVLYGVVFGVLAVPVVNNLFFLLKAMA